eukprot:TRINITY_DN39353_c0_g1_i1.p1 TRINITY_DN39353_c0_g1~~TRINITY_DN39353_c0_g1_i1.p1  ORF type:complete len:274 (+),score=81.41 TRINITY_DN39353_c0_g1_i1:48-824(+)
MEEKELAALSTAVQKLRQHPALVLQRELKPLRKCLLAFSAKLPVRAQTSGEDVDLLESDDGKESQKPKDKSSTAPQAAMDVADSDEEDAERLPEEQDAFPELPQLPPASEPDAAQSAACSAAKAAASSAQEAGDLPRALAKYTEAILTGASALLLARRAELLLTMRRPCAAIADCNAALEVNPDCGKAFRIRGIAERKLGRWEAAHRDLAIGQKLDYEESLREVVVLVAEKARVIEERRAADVATLEAAKNKRRRKAK